MLKWSRRRVSEPTFLAPTFSVGTGARIGERSESEPELAKGRSRNWKVTAPLEQTQTQAVLEGKYRTWCSTRSAKKQAGFLF